jgi:type I restriction enzyme S subunit
MGEIFKHDRLLNVECDRVPLSEKERETSLLEPSDLLFARQSLVLSGAGKCAIFVDDEEPVAFESHIIRVRLDQQMADPLYYYYLFRSPEGRSLIESIVEQGAGASGIRGTDLQELMVPAPLLPEQRAIAAVLGAFDDKIELNRRMNATLEAMARALFKSWFVDFDPVRAKMAGRDTGLPPAIAALFPDALVDSAVGEVPVGWEVGTVGDVVKPTIGGDWGKEEQFDGAVEVVCLRGVDLERLKADGWSNAPTRWIKKTSLTKRNVSDHDILIAASGVGPLGRSLWMIPTLREVFGMPVTYSNFCKRFHAKTSAHAVYADRILYNMRESEEIWKYASGTSIPNLNQDDLLGMHRIVIAPDELIQRYYEFVEPIYARLFNRESLHLAALRDTLLPKLMSGEVRISNVENLFGVV